MFISAVDQNSSQESPEHRLWTAVISSTLQDWLSGNVRAQREAETFLFQNETDFRLVCDAAGLDPGRLRARLSQLKRQGSGAADCAASRD